MLSVLILFLTCHAVGQLTMQTLEIVGITCIYKSGMASILMHAIINKVKCITDSLLSFILYFYYLTVSTVLGWLVGWLAWLFVLEGCGWHFMTL